MRIIVNARIIANSIISVAGVMAAGICFYAGRLVFEWPVMENIFLIGAGIYCLVLVAIHTILAVTRSSSPK